MQANTSVLMTCKVLHMKFTYMFVGFAVLQWLIVLPIWKK